MARGSQAKLNTIFSAAAARRATGSESGPEEPIAVIVPCRAGCCQVVERVESLERSDRLDRIRQEYWREHHGHGTR